MTFHLYVQNLLKLQLWAKWQNIILRRLSPKTQREVSVSMVNRKEEKTVYGDFYMLMRELEISDTLSCEVIILGCLVIVCSL